MIELAECISQAADLVDPALVSHHKEVALIARRIAQHMGLTEAEVADVYLASLVHDIGSLSFSERMAAVKFDYQDTFTHCEPGYLLLRQYPPFETIAHIVRMHHIQWRDGLGATFLGERVPLACHIIHVADRAAVLIDPAVPVLEQRDGICGRVAKYSGERFMPGVVDAFLDVARNDVMWLDVSGLPRGAHPADPPMPDGPRTRDWHELEAFAPMMSRIVDFRSAFTATHTAGVASTAVALGALLGMDDGQTSRIRVAGDLHDVGKLAVPTEILEKKGPLDAHEWAQMKSHTYHTYKVLTAGGAFAEIAGLAAYHHERLDESGYPFHLGEASLDEGSRLMAVADIFTALSEDRPYRAGMGRDEAISVLRETASAHATDGRIVEALVDDFENINNVRMAAQEERRREYVDFHCALGERAVQMAGAHMMS